MYLKEYIYKEYVMHIKEYIWGIYNAFKVIYI